MLICRDLCCPWISPTLADSSPGEKKPVELGIPYNIAVVDAGGGLVAHVRMDKTWLGSVDIAINAHGRLGYSTLPLDDLAKLTQSVQQEFGLNTTNNAKL